MYMYMIYVPLEHRFCMPIQGTYWNQERQRGVLRITTPSHAVVKIRDMASNSNPECGLVD